MTPNGRRAWRRFAKQQRRKVNRKNRETGTPWINDADGAFYRHEQRFFEQRPTLPTKPFTARSLVGMSEGAKKRLRERIFCGDQLPPFALGADSVTKGLRIGERLRPCPGCKCCGYPPPYGKLWTLTKGMWRIGSLYATDIKHICDGSGVLPARRSK